MSTSGLPWTYKNFCKMLGPEIDEELNRIFTKALEEEKMSTQEKSTIAKTQVRECIEQNFYPGARVMSGVDKAETKAEAVARCAVDVIAVGGIPYSNQLQDLIEAVCSWKEGDLCDVET